MNPRSEGLRKYNRSAGRDADRLAKRPKLTTQKPSQSGATVSIQDILEAKNATWLLNDPEFKRRIRALYESEIR